jgi:outer membrane protein TolC
MLRSTFIVLIVLIHHVMGLHTAQAQRITLTQAIDEALAHNPDLLSARQEWKAAGAALWEGISPDSPELFAEYEGIPRDSHDPSEYRARKMGFAQSFAFPLAYLFKGQWYHHQKKQKEAEFLSRRSGLINQVKKGFHRVVLLEKKKILFEEIENLTRQNVQKARIRVLAGESSPYDTLKVRVDLAEVENQVLTIKEGLDVAVSELGRLLGRKADIPVQIMGDFNFETLSLSLDSLRSLALAHHPSIKKARAEVAQQSAQRNLSWTGLMPDIHLRYFRHDLPYEPSPKAWGGMIGITVPLWFLLKNQGDIRSATYSLDAKRWNLASTERRVCQDVDKAFSQLTIAEKQVQNYQEKTLQEVEELVRIATRSYEEGEMGYLEVAESLRMLNRIKAGYYDALYRYLAAQADLEQAVGIPTIFENRGGNR